MPINKRQTDLPAGCDIVRKITHGFVVQVFDRKQKKWIGQEFVAGDEVEYENGNHETFVTEDAEELLDIGGKEPYLPFNMIQPGKITVELTEDEADALSCIGINPTSEYVIRGRPSPLFHAYKRAVKKIKQLLKTHDNV